MAGQNILLNTVYDPAPPLYNKRGKSNEMLVSLGPSVRGEFLLSSGLPILSLNHDEELMAQSSPTCHAHG